jgi:hypothetical protein
MSQEDLNRICINCGYRYGSHAGWDGVGGASGFLACPLGFYTSGLPMGFHKTNRFEPKEPEVVTNLSRKTEGTEKPQ